MKGSPIIGRAFRLVAFLSRCVYTVHERVVPTHDSAPYACFTCACVLSTFEDFLYAIVVRVCARTRRRFEKIAWEFGGCERRVKELDND